MGYNIHMARIDDRNLVKKIINQIRKGTSPPTAARLHGLSDDAFYDWLHLGQLADQSDNESPYRKFYLDVMAADASVEAGLTSKLMKAAETDWKAALEVLSRRYSRNWASKSHSKLEISHQEEQKSLPAEELADADLAKAIDDYYFRRAGLNPADIAEDEAITVEGQMIDVIPAS